jgi:hypothetical protein
VVRIGDQQQRLVELLTAHANANAPKTASRVIAFDPS